MDPVIIGVSVAAGAGAVALTLVLAARREAEIKRELKFKDDLRKIREALARQAEQRAREATKYPEASKPKPRKSSAPRTKRGSGSIVTDTPDLDSFVPVGVAWPPPQVTPQVTPLHSSGHSGDSHTSHHSSSHHGYGSSHSSGGYDGGSSSTSSSDSGGSSGGSSD